MVWVYNHPFSENDNKALLYLKHQLKEPKYARDIIKLLRLFAYVKKKKFRSASQLQKDVFIDKVNGKPFFNEKSAIKVFAALNKQKGGKSDMPYIQNAIDNGLEYIETNDPTPISWILKNGVWIVSLPIVTAKTILGEEFYELLSRPLHSGIKMGVSGVNSTAELIAGPIGLAIVGIFTTLAGAAGVTLAMAEGDKAVALEQLLNTIPGPGTTLANGVKDLDKYMKTIDGSRDTVESLPFGEYVSDLVPHIEEEPPSDKLKEPAAAGGKRFSVRRRIRTKCPRTQRQRFARR